MKKWTDRRLKRHGFTNALWRLEERDRTNKWLRDQPARAQAQADGQPISDSDIPIPAPTSNKQAEYGIMEFDLGDFTTNLARALSSFRLTEDTTFTVVEDKPVEEWERKRWRYIDCAHASGIDRIEVSTLNNSPMVEISIDITEAKPAQRTWGIMGPWRVKSAKFSPTRPLRALANSVINRVIVENSLALFARRDYVARLDKDAKEFEFKLAELKDALPELHVTHHRQPMGTSCGVYLSEIQGSLRVSNGEASVYVERVGTVTFTKFIAIARVLAEQDDALIDAILTVCSNPEGAKRLLEFLETTP